MIDNEEVAALERGDAIRPEAPSGQADAYAPREAETSNLPLAFSLLAPLALAACGGGGGGATPRPGPDDVQSPAAEAAAAPVEPASGATLVFGLPGSGGNQPADTRPLPSLRDAARFLAQASFGARSPAEIRALSQGGFEAWLWQQFNAPAMLHVSYLDRMRVLNPTRKSAAEEWSYEAIWQQWLAPEGQLRARVAFALSQIFVISNVAPDIKPYAMSSYWDLLNRNAFGNWRTLLQEVALHPAMGYYLNMLRSRKEDPKKGTHPNENFAREVMQLFSIGLVKLNADGSPQLDGAGKPIPTYDESVVKGYAAAFTGWSFGGQGNADQKLFGKSDFNSDANWVVPMLPFSSYHAGGSKQLLDGEVIPDGGTAQSDLKAALDSLFRHPNVGPFVGRQLIQRLVTSNPSAAYVARVAAVFADNGRGERGDLRAVVRAILLDAEARGDDAAARPRFGKLREPVLRFAGFLRALGAASSSGLNAIHYLDGADDALGQSPLLAPSVFNFFSPNYRHAGPLAGAGLVAPEFQITTETTVVGSLNFFHQLINNKGYGSGTRRLALDYAPLVALAGNAAQLVDRLDLLFFNTQMSASTRARMTALLGALASQSAEKRVKAALVLASIAPDFVVQK